MAEKLTPRIAAEEALKSALNPLEATLRANVFGDIPAEIIFAGGYLRDTIVGVPPKDIDVFVRFTAEDEFEKDGHVDAVRDRLFNEEFQAYPKDNEAYKEANPTILGVLGAEYLMPSNGRFFPVDFILHERSLERLIDSFDINVCKVAYTGGKFFYHPDFDEGLTNKKVEICKEFKTQEGSNLRRSRIERRLNKVWNPKSSTATKPPLHFTTDSNSMWTLTSNLSTTGLFTAK